MSQINYILWAIVIIFITTAMNLSSDNGSGSSRGWSGSSSSGGFSYGGGHK